MDIIELKDFICNSEAALVDKGYHRVEVTVRLGDQSLDSYRREFHVTVWSAKIDKFGHLESKEFYTPCHVTSDVDQVREVMREATAFVNNMPSMEVAVANTPIKALEEVVDSMSTVGIDSGSADAGLAVDELTAKIQAAVAKYKANLHGNGLLLTAQATWVDFLKPINLFHTPCDWDELMDWVNRHNKSDRPHLLTAAAMGWNLAVTTKESKEKEPNGTD